MVIVVIVGIVTNDLEPDEGLSEADAGPGGDSMTKGLLAGLVGGFLLLAGANPAVPAPTVTPATPTAPAATRIRAERQR